MLHSRIILRSYYDVVCFTIRRNERVHARASLAEKRRDQQTFQKNNSVTSWAVSLYIALQKDTLPITFRAAPMFAYIIRRIQMNIYPFA